MNVFGMFDSLRDTVYEYADAAYMNQISCDDYNGMLIGDYAPYYMVRDYGSSDWWEDCPYFQTALSDVRVQADRTQWRMKQLEPYLMD